MFLTLHLLCNSNQQEADGQGTCYREDNRDFATIGRYRFATSCSPPVWHLCYRLLRYSILSIQMCMLLNTHFYPDTSYMLLADTKNATRLAVLIKNQLALGEAKHTSLCEIILYAIARTVSVAEKKSTLTEQVQAFATVFGQPLSDDSSATPASMIASLATPALEGSFSSTTSTQNESLFVAVATSLKQVASASGKGSHSVLGETNFYIPFQNR